MAFAPDGPFTPGPEPTPNQWISPYTFQQRSTLQEKATHLEENAQRAAAQAAGNPRPGPRAVAYSMAADLGPVADILARERSTIVEHWLEAAAKQPFHQGEPKEVVSDHIPRLLDGLVAVLHRARERETTPQQPEQDPGVIEAAAGHARARAQQGLRSADIMTEFRLLRQEIWRTLRANVSADVAVADVLAAEVLINDGLDGAIRTSLDQHEKALEEARAALDRAHQEAEHEKEALLAAIAHDLKTPITSATGYLQLVMRWRSEGKGNGQLDASLAQVVKAHGRMMGLIEEFLDVAQLGANEPLHLTREPVNLVDLIEDVCSRADAQRVQLEVKDRDLVGGWDQSRLERVFENLIGNALKYSAPHTVVTVRIRREDQDGDRPFGVVEVQDAGIGIPPEELPRVFDRFHRARNAAGKAPGTGIGLAYAKQVLEQLGGSIAVTSEEGAGSTFTVRLPLTSP